LVPSAIEPLLGIYSFIMAADLHHSHLSTSEAVLFSARLSPNPMLIF